MKQEEHEQRIRGMLMPLLGEPRFEVFIGQLRAQRDVVLDDVCREDIIANDRVHLAMVGELRCYKHILAIYDDLLAHRNAEPQGEASES